MKTKDFDFILRKEFLILCFLLMALTFAQISLGQLSGVNKIEPFLKLNISPFETLGLILPVFTIAIVYFHNRSERTYVLPLLLLILGVVVTVSFVIALLGASLQPEENSQVPPDYNNTATTVIPATFQTSEATQPYSPLTPGESNSFESNFLLQLLLELRILLTIVVLFLPLLLFIAIRRKYRPETTSQIELDSDSKPETQQKTQYGMRTILECYNQASTSLEERGANNTPSFTPTEFSVDVIKKTLTPPLLIENLTNLFEEVKFSNHEIPDHKIELAKSFASKIIFSSGSSDKNNTDKETEEIT